MARQLTLINANEMDWRIDEHTKEVGRRGISDARDALRRAAAARAVTAWSNQ